MAGLRHSFGAFVALFAFFLSSAAQQQPCKHDSHAVFGRVIKTEDGRLAYRTGVLPGEAENVQQHATSWRFSQRTRTSML
jgi:hypothetical protein